KPSKMVGSHITLPLLLCILGIASARIEDVQQLKAVNVSTIDTENYQRLMQLRHLAVEFFDYYDNITVTDLIAPKLRLPNEQDLRCLAEMAQITQALRTGQLWALRMIDSWGRLPAGLLHGNLRDMGNFDECLRINHAIATTGQTLTGKYCFANLMSVSSLMSVRTAVCFPSGCTGDHMDTLLRQLLQRLLNVELNANTKLVNDSGCQTAEKEPLDGLAIFTIVLIGVLLGLLLLCTLYDYFLCKDQARMPAVVKIFSARVNSRQLFHVVDSKTNPNVIDCLHGIRCMSLIWVVFGHEYVMTGMGPNINLVDIYSWLKSPFSMFIVHGLFSVDTFFFLSGLLVVMIAMRSVEKSKGKINVPLMYLHRYLRLTPMVGLAICAYLSILPILGTGPIFKAFNNYNVKACQETWFWTLLYVQNYVVPDNCLPHSWYLSVDMQLYLFAPFLIIALYKWGKKAVAVIVILMLLLAGCLFSMMLIKGYSLNSGVQTDKIYFATHTRASPWAIGLLFGYYLHVNRGKSFKLNPLIVWAGWIFCLALIFACLFGIYPYAANGYELPILNEAFYVTLTRIAWPIALAWVVFACKYGYGGLANSFLSSPMWQPLSKLSYCAYIWHMFLQQFNTYTSRTSTYFSDYQVMLRFWSDFGFSVLLAYGMYILLEAPTGSLQMLLLPSGR
ncbi:hypothetical protein KR044_006721, partial [Drosophila immigrans]